MRWRWWGLGLLLVGALGLGRLMGGDEPASGVPAVAEAASRPALRADMAAQPPMARASSVLEGLPDTPTQGYTAALVDNPYAEANRLRLAGKPGTYAKASALFIWCAIVRMDLPNLKAMAAGHGAAVPQGMRPFDDVATNAARSKAIQVLEMKCADLGNFEAWSVHGAPDPDGQRLRALDTAEGIGPSRQRRALEELGRQGVLAEHLRRHMSSSGAYFFEGQRVPAGEERAFFTAVEMAGDEVMYAGFDYAKSIRGLHLCAALGFCSPSITPREAALLWAQTDPGGQAVIKYYDRVLAAIRANRYQAFMAPLR